VGCRSAGWMRGYGPVECVVYFGGSGGGGRRGGRRGLQVGGRFVGVYCPSWGGGRAYCSRGMGGAWPWGGVGGLGVQMIEITALVGLWCVGGEGGGFESDPHPLQTPHGSQPTLPG